MGVKQVLVLRKDLGMRKGKMVAQGAHASMKCLLDSGSLNDQQLVIPLDDPAVFEWVTTNFRKITVSVNAEAELLEVFEKAKAAGLPASLIIDNGLTEFAGVPTKTAVAVGPAFDERFKGITDHLPLL